MLSKAKIHLILSLIAMGGWSYGDESTTTNYAPANVSPSQAAPPSVQPSPPTVQVTSSAVQTTIPPSQGTPASPKVQVSSFDNTPLAEEQHWIDEGGDPYENTS